MKYLFLGGDERAVFAAEALLSEGNTVGALGMDRANLSGGVQKLSEICSADCYILPLPAESGRNGSLNAPFSGRALPASELLEALPADALVCGGKISPRLKAAAQEKGLRLADIMTRPSFVTGNAAITAEAAIALLMQRTDFSLFGKSVLVIGFGRIGKILCRRLEALDVNVHVMSVSPESRTMAEALGYASHAPDTPLPRLDAIVNTAPAPVLTRLDTVASPCLILELASAPGGFNPEAVTACGHRYFAASGLPAKYAPRTAGELLAAAVKNIVKEYENE